MNTVPTRSHLTQTDAAQLLELMEEARLAARRAAIAAIQDGPAVSSPELDQDGDAMAAVRQYVARLTQAKRGGRR